MSRGTLRSAITTHDQNAGAMVLTPTNPAREHHGATRKRKPNSDICTRDPVSGQDNKYFVTHVPAGQPGQVTAHQGLSRNSYQQGKYRTRQPKMSTSEKPDRDKKHRKVLRLLTPKDNGKTNGRNAEGLGRSGEGRGRYKILGSKREQNRPTPAPISRDRGQAHKNEAQKASPCPD